MNVCYSAHDGVPNNCIFSTDQVFSSHFPNQNCTIFHKKITISPIKIYKFPKWLALWKLYSLVFEPHLFSSCKSVFQKLIVKSNSFSCHHHFLHYHHQICTFLVSKLRGWVTFPSTSEPASERGWVSFRFANICW